MSDKPPTLPGKGNPVACPRHHLWHFHRLKSTIFVFRLAIDCNRWNADEPELDRVPDHYPRFVVSMDPVDLSRDGIRHLNICDFLEEE